MKTLIFDTETTGIPKHPNSKMNVQPKIIEFAGIIVDETGEIIDQMEFTLNPGEKLEAVTTKITGLTDEDLKDSPGFKDVLDELRNFFASADAMLAHNLPFDSTLLELELKRLGVTDFPFPEIKICTVQEHAEEWGRRPKLAELYEYYMKEKLNQTHRALDDVEALAKVAKSAGVLR